MGSRRVASRWLAGLLSVVLAGLSGFAVLGSRQQTGIVSQLADDSANTDAYQRTAFLVAWEMALLQATMREPGGEERRRLTTVYEQTQQAIVEMAAADHEDQELTVGIVRDHQGLGPQITAYLKRLDQADTGGAAEYLEKVIEPVTTRILGEVLAEQEHHLAGHAAQQAAGLRESRNVLWGSVLTFVASLIVLVMFGWSNHAHRRQVEALAVTDPLTSLPNRTAFAECAAHALAEDAGHRRNRRRTSPGRPTVLVVNLDGFRDVNDQLGHRIGDLLLAHAGRRLRSAVRESDFVARLGADEFALLLRDTDTTIGETIAVRVTEAFGDPFVIDDITIDLEVSVGAATAGPGEDVPTLLQHADTAMNIAKEQRLGFRRFSTTHTGDSNARLTLLGDLRRALDTGAEITLNYQPKIDIGTGALAGVEALARWRHPAKGAISPGTFIPVLEATTLIHRFTRQVLTEALAQTRTWLDLGHRVPVAVNISTRSLLDPAFPNLVASLLHHARVPGDQLCIEVTEHSIMTDPNTAIETLHRLRSLGVKTSIDDYGTGYSSMTYLRLLPLDELKIDRSFIKDLTSDASSHALVASTVELGHNLGLTVVAEGIEDAGTLDALHEFGCDLAQGYHLARPMTADALTGLLHRPAPVAA